MQLSISEKRKKQKNITRLAILIAVGFHVLLFVVLKTTGLDKVIEKRVIEIVEAIAPPPPPPPPPPEVKTEVKAPPKIDLKFDVKSLGNRPSVDAAFDLSMLPTMSTDMTAPDLSLQAMSVSTSDLTNLVSSAQLPALSLGLNIGFDIGTASFEAKKGSATGKGQRTTGRVALAVLDLPGQDNEDPWSGGELENIAEFISQNTNLKAELGARAISFIDNNTSFVDQLDVSLNRSLSEYKEISRQEAEIDAQNEIFNAMPYVQENNPEELKRRTRNVLTDFFRYRFNAKFNIDDTDSSDTSWISNIGKFTPLKGWQKEFIREAERSYKKLMSTEALTGKEVKGIYNFLRVSEIMRLPILLCDTRGVPETPLPENMRFLKTYIHNGGFIYFMNAFDRNEIMVTRGLIQSLIEEELDDPVGAQTLLELQKEDRQVTGYVFRDPEPRIFHPWTFFPMILPRYTSVAITIYNKIGNVVFVDTLKNMFPGTYTQKNRDYKWYAVDNQGNEVESGYYIYQISSDLARKTGPIRVSKLRRLPDGKHGLFSSFFKISEVPSTEAAKSENLPYGVEGVYGVSIKGRLVLCFTEGYKEKKMLSKEAASNDPSAHETTLKWVTNVVIHALSEGSLAR
jgi:hypothetical protein